MDEQGMRARIQQLIEHQHMNRQSFAEHIGVSPASLSQILNDKQKPTLAIVIAITNRSPPCDTTGCWTAKNRCSPTGPLRTRTPLPLRNKKEQRHPLAILFLLSPNQLEAHRLTATPRHQDLPHHNMR